MSEQQNNFPSFSGEYDSLKTEEAIINKILFSAKVKESVYEIEDSVHTTIMYDLPSGFRIYGTSICSDKRYHDITTGRAFAHSEAAKKLKIIRDYLLSFKTDGNYDLDAIADELKLNPSAEDSLDVPEPPFAMETRANIQARLWRSRF